MKELDKLQREIQELQEGNYALQDRLSVSFELSFKSNYFKGNPNALFM